MHASDWNRIKAVFGEALDVAPSERPAFLDTACGADHALRRQVESLLAAESSAGDFLVEPAVPRGTGDSSAEAGWNATAGSASAAADESPGTIIDRYRLIELLGEGGFGSVYAAEQTEPVRRRVALKIIKLGMNTRQVVQRFEAERQALAMMNHPHIAGVHDGGVTATGRPYFVMELVDGMPITEYCRQNGLDRRQRLELFRAVCNAVQHAHQKGVIHRDLKPSNVLVARPRDPGEPPVPKVIDFGIAKATVGKLTDATLITQQRQFVGTPAYMSPEQTGTGDDIDTRTDVYALGVLLYELLTDRTPFDPDTLRRASLSEVQRMICEQEPARPGSVDPTLRGDLDWIVTRAIEKDRARRYDSAAALAQDVTRHLTDEPVVAGPPGPLYRFGKFARRHRTLLTIAVVAVAGLVLSVASLTVGLLRTNRALARAQVAEQDALAQKAAADESRAAALASRDQAEAMVNFLQRMLGSAAPDRSLGGDMTVGQMLDEAAARIGEEFPDQPLVESRLRHAIGIAYWKLARYAEGETQLRDALELLERAPSPDPKLVALNLNSLGNLLQSVDRFEEAVAMFRRAVELGEPAFEPDSALPTMILANLGAALVEQGQYADAEPVLSEALERATRLTASQTAQKADVLLIAGQLYDRTGRKEEAEDLYRRALAARREALPPEHPDLAKALRALGQVMVERGDYAGASELFREMIAINRAVLGQHPQLALALNNLADLQGRLGNHEEAERLLREAEAIQRAAFGDAHTDLAFTLNNLAGALYRLGRPDAAMDALRESIAIHRAVNGDEHPDVASGMSNLAILLMAAEDYDEAEGVAREALDLQTALLGDDHPAVRSTMLNLANILTQTGKLEEAEALFRDVVRRADALPDGHVARYTSGAALGEFLGSIGRYEEAEACLLDAYEQMAQRGAAEHPAARQIARMLGALYQQWDKPEQAQRWQQRGTPATSE